MKALAITYAPRLDRNLGGGMPRSRQQRPSLLARLATWRRIARERRQLAELEPHMLADMGLTRDDALREANRPFWDMPAR